MKRILTAVALTALAASPALAQYSWGSPAMQSYAAAPIVYGDVATGSPYVGPHTVIAEGRIVGADPDADIRTELRKNPQGQAN